MAKNSTNRIVIEEQDYLSEQQKKKQEEEERKRKEREAREAAEKAAKEAAAKAVSEANGVTDNSASALAQKAAQKVTPINNYKKAVAEAKNEHARKVSEGENITDSSAKAFADRAARKQASAQIVKDYRDAYRNTLEGAVDGGFFEKPEGPTARQQAQNRISENVADRMEGGGAPADYRGRQQERLSDNIFNVYEGMDKQLRRDVYDSAIDNQASSMIAEWIYSPGAALAKYGTAAGEALKQNDKQYISPAAAKRYNLGQNLGERAGADEQNGFTAGETIESDSGDIRKALGDWILKAYEDNAALAYEGQANLRRQAALEQSETPLGDVALSLATSLNNMAVSAGYSAVTGMPLSSYMAFTGGADKTADYLEAGYDPLAAIGAGIAWGKVMKEIEGGSSFGHVSGGIVDTATKKIGNEAVKLAGKFVDGKTVATVIDLAKGPIAKRLFSGLGEGLEEVVEYNLEYVFDSILGRDDVSFDVKDMLYSGLLGALCGEFFEFSTAYNIPAELSYHFSEEGKAERAADIKEYLDKVDPKILESVSTGDLKLVEDVMKNISAKAFENAIPQGKSNPLRIGNNVFGAGIFEKTDSGQDGVFGRSTLSEETPVPFNGNAVTEEQKLIADKITEIENRPISEAEKAAKMEEVMEKAAQLGTEPGLVEEAEKFKNIHEERASAETQSTTGQVNPESESTNAFGPEIVNKILGISLEEKIKMDKKTEAGIVGRGDQNGTPTPYSASEIRIPDIISKINPKDGTMLKYLPDEMLTAEQLEGKRKELEKNALKIENLPKKSGNFSGLNTPPSIENNIFGAGIFGNLNSEEKTGVADGTNNLDAVTSSMERADAKLGAEDWKHIAESIDVETGIWRMKDLARVLDSAAGGNKILRQQLYELYEKPLNEAQGAYAANYEAKAKEISDKFKELGIKAGSNESAAVQRIGEGVKEIDKNGNTVPYTLDDLKKEFPDSWEKIKAGADFCREIYDKFLLDLNAMYSEIYPATIEQANERVSNYDVRILSDSKKIGNIEEVRNNLEMDIIRKTTELSKKRPNTLVYAEIQNQIENAKRRIEKADRIIEKLENRKLTKEIARDTLKAQIENGEILQNKQIRPRADYFRHFQELTNEFAEIADIFSNDQRIPPNLAGKSETTKPRTIWTSIAQKRGKNYYTEDAVGGLLRYTEIAEKLLAYDPLISHFRDVNSAIRAAGTMVENEVKGKGTNAGQFASWADDITNQLAGKTNRLDRLIADNTGALGRATIKAVEALNRRVKSNAILGNFRSALVQIGNLPNATLYIQNPIDWRNGVVSTISSVTGHSPEIKEARNNSNFMNRRYMGDSIDEITKEIQQNKILDKPKEFAIWMLGAGDRAAAEIIWHTAYTRALRNPEVLSSQKGQREYDSAVDYADDITRRSIGGRAEGDIPYFEESKITGLVAPFEIEVANTFNAFSEQLGKKNAAGIVAFEISVFLLNTVLEGITGDRPLGLDFIDAALDIIKEATGDEEDEEEKDLWDIITYAGGRIGGEVLSSMPYGTQIGSILTGGDEQKAEDWFGDSDPTRYGTGNIGMGALADAVDYFREGETPEKFYDLITDGKKNSYSEWAKPVLDTVDTFAPLVMPWGGKQLSRTLGGLDQIIQGGAYGEKDGEPYLKYLQDQDPANILKTLVFGRYGGDSAQEYIDSGFKGALSAKQTEQMKLAEKWGISNEEFYDLVLDLRDFDKKKDKQEALFANENFTSGEKGILEQILFGENKYGKGYDSRDYYSEDSFYRSGLSEGGKNLFDAGYSREDIETIEAVSGNGKKSEEIGKIAKALDISEAEAFKVYQERNGDWIYGKDDLSEEEYARLSGAAKLYGMSTDDYSAVLNYSKFGTVVTDENGEENYSTKMEDVIPKIMEATGWDEETAKKNYLMVNKYEYSREDIEEAQTFDLDTSQSWYEVDDKGYLVARNVLKTVEGTKDEYGNTISGSKKEAAIKEIEKQLGVNEEEATIYYLAAEGKLILSTDDMETTQIEDMKEAVKHGWTERQFMDAMNVIKVSGASKKEEILKALQDAGATYEMAQGYYNLKENADYDRFVGKVTYKYGVQKKKQEVKCDYFLKNYNGDGSVTAKDMANWFAAGAGCKKKQEYIDAYMSAGATYSQALKFYSLMQGHDDDFNAWYKENGG